MVTGASDRSGLRLSGPSLPRGREGELPSEGMVTGALQVPPDGRPILFLADHPVTGGYPVIAVVVSAGIPRAAQLRPGDSVRFRIGPGGRPPGSPRDAPLRCSPWHRPLAGPEARTLYDPGGRRPDPPATPR